MLATTKQIDLAIRLEIRLRRLAPTQRDFRAAELAKKTKQELDQLIKALNQHTGFKPAITPATPNQRKYLETLERECGVRVTPENVRMTYADADDAIRFYRNLRKAQASDEPMTPVVDIRTRKAV